MIFHLAIPAVDLDDSVKFYEKLGATVGRKYETNVILNFMGIQLVLHKCRPEDVDQEPKMYPRHFGFVLPWLEYSDLFTKWHSSAFYKDIVRYKGARGEHQSFFLCDPSNNLIEFKYYTHYCDIFDSP